MSDELDLVFNQAVQSTGGVWYRILQPLGTGGNATTFLVLAISGEHRGVPFALKVFRRISRPEWRQNFLQEIDFLKGCNHPAIMRVFDEGLHQTAHPFVVAEY